MFNDDYCYQDYEYDDDLTVMKMILMRIEIAMMLIMKLYGYIDQVFGDDNTERNAYFESFFSLINDAIKNNFKIFPITFKTNVSSGL